MNRSIVWFHFKRNNQARLFTFKFVNQPEPGEIIKSIEFDGKVVQSAMSESGVRSSRREPKKKETENRISLGDKKPIRNLEKTTSPR